MSEQNVREALEKARVDLELWHEGANTYTGPDGSIRTHPCSGCSTCEETLPAIVAALTSSPSEPLVEVEDLASKFYNAATFLVNTGLGYKTNPRFFDECKGDIAALITARDAQVAARVREECEYREIQLRNALERIALGVEINHVVIARAALTATGGGK